MGKHGKPDWGMQVKSTVYTLDELSELAVRLGSEVFFDRRGDVLLIDNFENGRTMSFWEKDGAGSEVVITADHARSGGYSTKLVGGSTDDLYADISYRLTYPVVSKFGFETHFSIPTQFDRIEFTVWYYTGT
ncbi:unnamed protein product, partial [marine sediment metagenome]